MSKVWVTLLIVWIVILIGDILVRRWDLVVLTLALLVFNAIAILTPPRRKRSKWNPPT